MKCGEIIEHILAVRKIDKDIFWNKYSRVEKYNVYNANKLNPVVKKVAKELEVEPYFLLKMSEKLEGINHFPDYAISNMYVVGRYKAVNLSYSKYIDDFLKNISVEMIYERLKNAGNDYNTNISIKLNKEWTRDLYSNNIVENDVTVLYAANITFSMNVKLYHMFYTKKRIKFVIHVKSVVKDANRGTYENVIEFYIGDVRYIGKVVQKKLDSPIYGYCDDYIYSIRTYENLAKKDKLQLGKDNENSYESIFVLKKRKAEVGLLENQISMSNIILAYEENKRNEIFD